ncbi:MAG: hypothetical protein ACE5H8_13695, partial [Alphaproteobacteria bacterium]
MTANGFHRAFRISRSKLQHGVLLGAVLGAIGLASFVFAGPALPDGRLVGAVNLVLAAGVLGYVVVTARNRKPRMTLDGEGLWFADWGLDKVPWPQIADTSIGGTRFNSYLSVELRDADALFASLDVRARRKIRSNRLVRPPRLLVPNGALDAGLDEIAAA